MALEWPDDVVENAILSRILDERVFLVSWRLENRRDAWQLNVRCEADDGISIDQLATINRALRDEFQLPGLDTEKLSVEVSSPGLKYPITKPRHFKRYTGHQIKFEHDLPAVDNPVTGTIEAVEQEVVIIQSDKSRIHLPLQNIQAGFVQLKW
ncbi:MAG: hypothetical protein K9N11_02280 [Lentisphaeria bacterium]|nr:hypothetical protein [Candidatus Neomarinimicrobiota bacterium]MCF7841657.1 hypothetical protein [Lentisphaeria bacterium]